MSFLEQSCGPILVKALAMSKDEDYTLQLKVDADVSCYGAMMVLSSIHWHMGFWLCRAHPKQRAQPDRACLVLHPVTVSAVHEPFGVYI